MVGQRRIYRLTTEKECLRCGLTISIVWFTLSNCNMNLLASNLKSSKCIDQGMGVAREQIFNETHFALASQTDQVLLGLSQTV